MTGFQLNASLGRWQYSASVLHTLLKNGGFFPIGDIAETDDSVLTLWGDKDGNKALILSYAGGARAIAFTPTEALDVGTGGPYG